MDFALFDRAGNRIYKKDDKPVEPKPVLVKEEIESDAESEYTEDEIVEDIRDAEIASLKETIKAQQDIFALIKKELGPGGKHIFDKIGHDIDDHVEFGQKELAKRMDNLKTQLNATANHLNMIGDGIKKLELADPVVATEIEKKKLSCKCGKILAHNNKSGICKVCHAKKAMSYFQKQMEKAELKTKTLKNDEE